tara:strand:- start:6 stop:395 length:390 start_codon:yes stop_codon:yes gene_type:complete
MKVGEKYNHPVFGEMDVISVYTGEQAESDGMFINLTEYAKENFGYQAIVRFSINLRKIAVIESETDNTWTVNRPVADYILSTFKEKYEEDRGVFHREGLVQFDFEGQRIWVMPDTSSGKALHFFTPEEY